MNPVRKALHELLSGDKVLKELATGVHWKQADGDAKLPYIIFSRPSEVPVRAFGGPSLDKEVYLVKGVGEADVAERIAKRCRELLDNAVLNIEGRSSLDVYRIGAVDYAETVDGERFDHVGNVYKIDSEEMEE